MIKILIVDDSPTETALLKMIFESENDFQVIGCAKNGKEAVEKTIELKPDIITMDIRMPVMGGLEATRMIMMQCPIPIVVISSKANDKEIPITFQALEAGALSVLEKPVSPHSTKFDKVRKRIVETVRSMSEIKVVKKRFNTSQLAKAKIQKPEQIVNNQSDNYELIAIGTSVGGPQVLKQILSKLPKDFPIPIVIVQHMTQGFMAGFTTWLNETLLIKIKNAENFELLEKGTVYFAPDNHHLTITRSQLGLTTKLVKSAPVSGFCPSATMLLQSVAKTCGKNAVGVLLTGMGNDGAQGLLELKQAGGHTFIQDEKSAVVFGMAGVAKSLNAVDKIIELDNISDYLIKLADEKIRTELS